MNKIKEESLFAQAALAKGYLSKQQLAAVARVKRSNPQITIAEICHHYHLLTPEQTASIYTEMQRTAAVLPQNNGGKRLRPLSAPRNGSTRQPSSSKHLSDEDTAINQMSKPGDRLFARMLIRQGLVTLADIQKCLKELASGPEELTLGQLLVKKRLLDARSFSKIYRHFQGIRLGCPHCHQNYSMAQLCQLRKDYCPDCGCKLKQLSQSETLASDPSPAERPLASNNFGKYILVEEIARGGMGVVYKAQEKGSSRLVALKVMRQLDTIADDQIVRFKREIATVGKLNHPNIVRIYDAGSIASTHYFTMEYIAGETFADTITSHNRNIHQVIEIVEKVARAVHYAHTHNIVHRDLKPANILIDSNGQPHVTDFGLAKDLSRHTRLTQTGATLGTPYYMAPEQIESQNTRIGAATDIYALGVILYEALTGKLPFVAETLAQLYAKILSEPPAPLCKHAPSLPHALERITLKAMAREINWRYSSARALAEDLKRFRTGKRVLARPVAFWKICWSSLLQNTLWLLPVAGFLLLLISAVVCWLAAPFAVGSDPTASAIAKEIAEIKLLLAKKNYPQAQARASRLLLTYGQRPDILPLYKLHAQSYEGQGEFTQAHRQYQHFYIQSGNAEDELTALQGMMRCQLNSGDYLKAWKIWQTTEQRFPQARERFAELAARICFHIGEFKKSSRYFSQLAPDSSRHQRFYRNWLSYLTPVAVFAHSDIAAMGLVDSDNDGRTEIALISPEKIYIYRWRQHQREEVCQLTPPANTSFANIAASGDIDGDGNAELITVVHRPERGYELLLFVKKNGKFQATHSHYLHSSVNDIAVAAAAPGHPTVVAVAIGAFARNSKILYWHNGQFQIIEIDPALRQSHTNTETITFADIDQDGKNELLLGTGCWSGYDLRVYGNRGGATRLYLQTTKKMGIVSVCRVADLDGDGFPEILAGKSRTVNTEVFGSEQPYGDPDGLYVLRKNGSSLTTVWQHTFPPGKNPHHHLKFLATGHIKGLGQVATVLYSCYRITRNEGSKRTSAEQQVWLLWWNGSYQLLRFTTEGTISGLALADIDNDGSAELLLLQPKQLLIYGIEQKQ